MTQKLGGGKTTRKLVSLTPELAARVDEYRWGNRIGSESEALRRLITAGLDAADLFAKYTPDTE